MAAKAAGGSGRPLRNSIFACATRQPGKSFLVVLHTRGHMSNMVNSSLCDMISCNKSAGRLTRELLVATAAAAAAAAFLSSSCFSSVPSFFWRFVGEADAAAASRGRDIRRLQLQLAICFFDGGRSAVQATEKKYFHNVRHTFASVDFSACLIRSLHKMQRPRKRLCIPPRYMHGGSPYYPTCEHKQEHPHIQTTDPCPRLQDPEQSTPFISQFLDSLESYSVVAHCKDIAADLKTQLDFVCQLRNYPFGTKSAECVRKPADILFEATDTLQATTRFTLKHTMSAARDYGVLPGLLVPWNVWEPFCRRVKSAFACYSHQQFYECLVSHATTSLLAEIDAAFAKHKKRYVDYVWGVAAALYFGLKLTTATRMQPQRPVIVASKHKSSIDPCSFIQLWEQEELDPSLPTSSQTTQQPWTLFFRFRGLDINVNTICLEPETMLGLVSMSMWRGDECLPVYLCAYLRQYHNGICQDLDVPQFARVLHYLQQHGSRWLLADLWPIIVQYLTY
jgi:hypothetical protein